MWMNGAGKVNVEQQNGNMGHRTGLEKEKCLLGVCVRARWFQGGICDATTKMVVVEEGGSIQGKSSML